MADSVQFDLAPGGFEGGDFGGGEAPAGAGGWSQRALEFVTLHKTTLLGGLVLLVLLALAWRWWAARKGGKEALSGEESEEDAEEESDDVEHSDAVDDEYDSEDDEYEEDEDDVVPPSIDVDEEVTATVDDVFPGPTMKKRRSSRGE